MKLKQLLLEIDSTKLVDLSNYVFKDRGHLLIDLEIQGDEENDAPIRKMKPGSKFKFQLLADDKKTNNWFIGKVGNEYYNAPWVDKYYIADITKLNK